MSLDLFSYAERAAQLREAGMALAKGAQDGKDPAWAECAYAAIVAAAKLGPTVHVDNVLAIFKVAPSHPNAWGTVWLRAIKAGIISRTGTVKPCVTDPGKHKHQYPVYASNLHDVQRRERAA